MDDRIKALAAQQRRIEAKQAALSERVRTLKAEFNCAFGGTTLGGASDDETFEIYSSDDYCFGDLSYRDGKLTVGFRTTEDDRIVRYRGYSEVEKGYTVRPLAEFALPFLERLLNEKTLASLLNNIASQLEQGEARLDRPLVALQAIVAGESAKLDEQVDASLQQPGCETLSQNRQEALDATHLDTADGLTRSSRFLETVYSTILRERGKILPRDKSLTPLLGCMCRMPGLARPDRIGRCEASVRWREIDQWRRWGLAKPLSHRAWGRPAIFQRSMCPMRCLRRTLSPR
ncbi:hypothetical protein LJ656_34640 [Paraburkholderia sp. MMS20-SJTR3]|uniref:Uncharacterized protein n=1 Tax=Paraburkholderia sejongensis TaxID=2886946 RepID=A0ABS8K688_9BURK|nr:hypothetical protein [Paraburkholderia sp. MMS20-SJTR3]MCC8397677.1 hypothetical protein [Paraburkholderia sp. MMS20-SJTR3]